MGMMPGASGQSHAQAGRACPGGAMARQACSLRAPGSGPVLYAQHMGRGGAATVAAASAGPAGSAAASEFVSSSTACCRVRWSTSRAPSQTRAPRARAPSGARSDARYLKKRKDRNFEKKVR